MTVNRNVVSFISFSRRTLQILSILKTSVRKYVASFCLFHFCRRKVLWEGRGRLEEVHFYNSFGNYGNPDMKSAPWYTTHHDPQTQRSLEFYCNITCKQIWRLLFLKHYFLFILLISWHDAAFLIKSFSISLGSNIRNVGSLISWDQIERDGGILHNYCNMAVAVLFKPSIINFDNFEETDTEVFYGLTAPYYLYIPYLECLTFIFPQYVWRRTAAPFPY